MSNEYATKYLDYISDVAERAQKNWELLNNLSDDQPVIVNIHISNRGVEVHLLASSFLKLYGDYEYKVDEYNSEYYGSKLYIRPDLKLALEVFSLANNEDFRKAKEEKEKED